jgi:hypothetical protein
VIKRKLVPLTKEDFPYVFEDIIDHLLLIYNSQNEDDKDYLTNLVIKRKDKIKDPCLLAAFTGGGCMMKDYMNGKPCHEDCIVKIKNRVDCYINKES